ncbi:MAG: hypothetical protein LAO19_03735 [Acidobacteriia bacterium]|nr:hypothetical protein [Terriglobia bacterium]
MAETTYSIRRTTPRFAFIAEAEVIGLGGRSRVSELSARGCYVDTINPLPKESVVRLLIQYGPSSCEFPAKVIYTHAGFGMGLIFGELNAEQSSTLGVWLEELARKSEGQ